MTKEKIRAHGLGFGYSYEGIEPIGTTSKIGLIILAAVGIGCCIGFQFTKRKKKNNTDQDIRKNIAETQTKVEIDNAHTENEIKKMQVASEIKIQERKAMYELNRDFHLESQKGNSASKPKMSQHAWIVKHHSEYPMPDYSAIPLLDQILAGCPDGYQDAMILHLLTLFGGLCYSRVRAIFLDNKMHSPSLLTIIEGVSGSGKGIFDTIYKELFQRNIESDRKKLENDNLGQIIQTAGINVSASKYMDILASNKGVHIYAMETEISAVKKAFSKKGGIDSMYFRKAFDNDYVYQNNKSKDSAKGLYPVFFNCTITGTPKAIDSLINEEEVEGGTARRICFSVIPELGANSPTLELPEALELEGIRNKIDEWRSAYCFYHDSDKGDIPCAEYTIDLDYVNKALDNWNHQQYARFIKDEVAERNQVRNGIACVAFHCAIVLHMLAGNPSSKQKKKRKTVKELSIYIANYCMERYITRYAKTGNASQTADDVASNDPSPIQKKRKLTIEEIEQWYNVKGTLDENGKKIGYGTIAKKLGVTKDEVRNAFKRYENAKF